MLADAAAGNGVRAGGAALLPGTPVLDSDATRLGPAAPRVFSLEVLPFPCGVSGFGASALVLVDAPPRSLAPTVEACRKLFGLTPAESQLARLLAQDGSGAKSLARQLGVSPATARTHLQRIFDKTGVHSQADLVSLLRRLAVSA